MHIVRRLVMYIHQNPDWPKFLWDDRTILNLLSKVRNLQGRLIGKMEGLGFLLSEEAMLETLTIDVVKSSEIPDSSQKKINF